MMRNTSRDETSKNLFLPTSLLLLAGSVILMMALRYKVGSDSELPPPVKKSKRLVVFIDQSASQEQQEHWLPEAKKMLKHFFDKGTIEVYGIHDHSAESKPIYPVTELPGLEEGTDYEEEKEVIAQRDKIWREVETKITEAFNLPLEQRAKATDLVSAVARIKADAGQPTTLVFFSDMLHSKPGDFDLEKTELNAKNTRSLLSSLLESGDKLHARQLAGCRVHCILNSVEIDGKHLVNDRTTLRNFWEIFFRSLGAGSLETFDTNFGILTPAQPEAGQSNAE